MSVNLELLGIDELTQKIEEIGKKATSNMTLALEKAAEPILVDAKSTRAFNDRSGNLRKSLKKSKVKNSKGKKTIWIGDVDREVSYSWFVEYGHSRATAKPFLRPAWIKNKEQAQQIIKKTLREGLNI